MFVKQDSFRNAAAAAEKIQHKNNKKQSLISLHDIMSAFKYIYKCTNIQKKGCGTLLRDVPWNLNHTVQKVRNIEMQDATPQSVRLMLK